MLSLGWKVSNLIKEKLRKQQGAVFILIKLFDSNIKRHYFLPFIEAKPQFTLFSEPIFLWE